MKGCVCTRVRACMYMCVYIHVEDRGQPQMLHPISHCPPCFLRQSLSCGACWLGWAVWPFLPVSTSSTLGSQHVLLYMCSGNQTGVLMLSQGHFTEPPPHPCVQDLQGRGDEGPEEQEFSVSVHRPHKKCCVVIRGKDCLTVYFALDKDERESNDFLGFSAQHIYLANLLSCYIF